MTCRDENGEIVDLEVKIVKIEERKSKKSEWPWVKIYCIGLFDKKSYIIHYYSWEPFWDRELPLIETNKKYDIRTVKHEKNTYYNIKKINAELI